MHPQLNTGYRLCVNKFHKSYKSEILMVDLDLLHQKTWGYLRLYSFIKTCVTYAPNIFFSAD